MVWGGAKPPPQKKKPTPANFAYEVDLKINLR